MQYSWLPAPALNSAAAAASLLLQLLLLLLQGHWRLLFQYTLADMLGYKYLWQLDDDSELSLPLKASLIPWMKQHKVLMAYRRAYRDKVMVTWGLPELTR